MDKKKREEKHANKFDKLKEEEKKHEEIFNSMFRNWMLVVYQNKNLAVLLFLV
jgi:rubrerythrin